MTDTNLTESSDRPAALSPPQGDWPPDGLERVPTCPVCASAKRSTLHPALRDGIFFCAPGAWHMHRCLECRSAYLDPRPTVATIGLAYSSYYTHRSIDEDPIGMSEPGGRWARAKVALRNGYLWKTLNIRWSPAWGVGRWIVPLLFPIRARLFSSWFRYLALPFRGARLMDLGCGNGDFVRRANWIGWQAEGMDPDPSAVAAGRAGGLNIHHGSLPDTGLESAAYDAVMLNHVMEHVHDPGASLREAFRLLKPGGTVWITTPNIDSPLHRRMGADWRGLETPRHLVIFNHASLQRALSGAGFVRPKKVRSLPMIAWMLEASLKIVAGLPSGPELGRPFSPSERRYVRRLTWAMFLRPEWGEEVVLTARKPTV